MKNLSEKKILNSKDKGQKNLKKYRTKEENNSKTKSTNKKSKKIKHRNPDNDEYFPKTQLEKEQSKKTNNSLLYSKNKDKNLKYTTYLKNSKKINNIKDLKKEYSLCQKEIMLLKDKEEELKILKNQLKLTRENYNIYTNNNIGLSNTTIQPKIRENKLEKEDKKLSYKASKIKDLKKNINNHSMIEISNSENKKLKFLKMNKSDKIHSKSKSNDKNKQSHQLINKINTYKTNISKSTERKKYEPKYKLFIKTPNKNVINLNKNYYYPGSSKNTKYNKTVSNSHKKIPKFHKAKNDGISTKRNKSSLNNSENTPENKSKTYNNYLSKSKNETKQNSSNKKKVEKENEEKKDISEDNEIKIKCIEKIGILSKGGKEENGEDKINQDNYFDNDLCHGYKFIGVCDGHGEDGQNVSEYLRNILPEELNKELNKLASKENKRLSILESILEKNRNELLNTENKNEKKQKIYLHENFENFENIKEIFKKVFVSTNLKLIDENYMLNLENSGSTCVSILLHKDKINKIYIANVGDSRAIIIKQPSKEKIDNKDNTFSYIQLSRDHKPSEKDEAERILKHGGEIQQLQNDEGEFEGPFRIYMKDEEGPGLAMSRSFGDVIGSVLGVIAEPEVKEYIVEEEDKVIIIASDGLWEYVSNEEVTDIVKNFINKKDPNLIVNELYKFSYERWKAKDIGIDDITIICVLLN